jgi:hypothetical protein
MTSELNQNEQVRPSGHPSGSLSFSLELMEQQQALAETTQARLNEDSSEVHLEMFNTRCHSGRVIMAFREKKEGKRKSEHPRHGSDGRGENEVEV